MLEDIGIRNKNTQLLRVTTVYAMKNQPFIAGRIAVVACRGFQGNHDDAGGVDATVVNAMCCFQICEDGGKRKQ